MTRIKERNKLDEEEAKKRISSQMTNEERVKKANVVLCTLWEYDVTKKQVRKITTEHLRKIYVSFHLSTFFI